MHLDAEQSFNHQQTHDIKLGIVCPMANERANAVPFINAVLEQCPPQHFKSVIFFAILDHASKDGTLEILRKLETEQTHLRVVWSPENRGVVDAYVRGYREALAAGCDWILEIDAGFSHQPSDIPQFFERMREGYDCVFGSRFCAGGEITETSLKRRLVSQGGTLLTNLLLGTQLKDMTSGFEMFSRRALQQVLEKGIHSRGHFFQTEIKAHCRGLRIIEVPIHYRAASNSVNQKVVKDAFVNLWRLFQLRLSGRL
jgi:dolichol-phosphate mannosyltransferase